MADIWKMLRKNFNFVFKDERVRHEIRKKNNLKTYE